MADTRGGQVQVGADVPSVRKGTATPFGLCRSSRLLAAAQEDRLSLSGDVVPQLTCQQLKLPAYRLGCGNAWMATGMAHKGGCW